ncbi:AraC family transcriptional regulator [Streptomyces sp. NPDC088387]|uniref:AraC family transcriptional regulator n=1 Tax=Streptomyces sp. NPDC088387 TaxID=3365859 RepID=UPI003810EEB2
MAEVVEGCSEVFYRHDMDQLDRSRPFSVSYRISQAGPVTVGDVRYDADMRLDFRELATGYHVNIPVHGVLRSQHRGVDNTAAPGLATVFNPEGKTVFTHWPANSRILAVKLDSGAVSQTLATAVGRKVPLPDVESGLDVRTGPGRSLAQMLMLFSDQLGDASSALCNPLVAQPFAESVINAFLLATSSAFQEAVAGHSEAARPVAVRAATDLVEASPHLPWTTASLAAQCHVGARALQRGFQQHLGVSPMAYLREVRLRRAREDLLADDPASATVTTIARRWGFSHLSRFAAAYRDAYGELPARTLRAPRHVN